MFRESRLGYSDNFTSPHRDTERYTLSSLLPSGVCVCVCVVWCVCVCVHARARACVCACVRACVLSLHLVRTVQDDESLDQFWLSVCYTPAESEQHKSKRSPSTMSMTTFLLPQYYTQKCLNYRVML